MENLIRLVRGNARNRFADTVETLALVNEEVQSQDARWGDQTYPLRMRPIRGMENIDRAEYAKQAEELKAANDTRADLGLLAWDSILLEEVFEALEAETPEAAVEELIQVAAVAVNAAMSIQRHGLQGKAA